MSEPSGKSPEVEERERRLAAALRENLKRRKAQARGRETARRETPPADGEGQN